MVGFLFISLFSMLISLSSSIAGKYVVDAATGFQSEFFLKYIIIMLATSLVSILFSAGVGMFSNYVNERFAFSIKAKMYDRVQRSIWYKLSKYHSGDLLSRLTSDIDTVASTVISLLPNLIVTGIQLVIVLGILVVFDPTLAIVGLVVGPIGFLAAMLYRKKYTKYQIKLRESQSEYYSFFQETLSNIGVIKTFQLEDENNNLFKNIRKKRMKLVIESSVLSSIMGSMMRLVYTLGYIAAFTWCAYRLSTATVYINSAGVEVATYTYGTMTLFLTLVSQVQGSIRALGSVIPKMYSLIVCAKRIREITEIEDEVYSEDKSAPKCVSLKVNGVSFKYENDTVLSNLNFTVPANKHIGIVGSSGAGKTTFIRLLLSLIEPDNGTIEYVDENGKAEIVSPSSRRFISYVPQGNTLLSGSVRSNLLTGNKDATDEQMWAALKLADADGFVKNTDKGLDCEISERATGLSEGQAQRISIARALIRDKPVLILDEATSALDESSEARIFERITKDKNKTCFIITHRSSMLKYCDMIIEINENGTANIKENA
ncbi:MAG: ABC transporter ATP-binding protein [Eubacteriales bacterium]|nr:ABC transporter ATP-binding protein [Eubacteriales bacterium]